MKLVNGPLAAAWRVRAAGAPGADVPLLATKLPVALVRLSSVDGAAKGPAGRQGAEAHTEPRGVVGDVRALPPRGAAATLTEGGGPVRGQPGPLRATVLGVARADTATAPAF